MCLVIKLTTVNKESFNSAKFTSSSLQSFYRFVKYVQVKEVFAVLLRVTKVYCFF